MLAVIETGGKQYLTKSGQVLKIEKIVSETGKEFSFDKVLLLAEDDGCKLQLGSPYVSGAKVVATVDAQGRSKKIRVVKFKNKIRYRRANGHRQAFTRIKVK